MTNDEREFLASYDPAEFPAVAITVDVVALTIRDGRLHVLLVERGESPFAGWRALPADQVDGGPEKLSSCAQSQDPPPPGPTPPGRQTSTRSMPPALARFTYSGIQSSPRMRRAISTTM